jgi:threonine dehydratase
MSLDLPTPLTPGPEDLAPGRRLLLKREEGNELGAFKWRGALPTVARWRERGAVTVVTASTGNHGAAVAWAARRLGMPAIVYAPGGASREKLELIEELGARVRLIGSDLDEAKDEARAYALREGLPFFEDGAEPDQYEGYGHIAEEILEQCAPAPGAIVVPVGNGALACGIGLVVKRRSPKTLVVGVAARDAPVMEMSWRAGRPMPCDRMATFADGLAVRVAIPRAVALLKETVDRMLLVSERAMARAVCAFARAGLRVEGAAAAGLAALPQVPEVAGPVVLVVTGGNIDEELWERAVETPDSFPN